MEFCTYATHEIESIIIRKVDTWPPRASDWFPLNSLGTVNFFQVANRPSLESFLPRDRWLSLCSNSLYDEEAYRLLNDVSFSFCAFRATRHRHHRGLFSIFEVVLFEARLRPNASFLAFFCTVFYLTFFLLEARKDLSGHSSPKICLFFALCQSLKRHNSLAFPVGPVQISSVRNWACLGRLKLLHLQVHQENLTCLRSCCKNPLHKHYLQKVFKSFSDITIS